MSARFKRGSAEEFEDGRNRADRTDAEIASPALKGAEHFGSYKSRVL
ncbi:MAG: hypothetical protein ACK56F_31580 [bacterium]